MKGKVKLKDCFVSCRLLLVIAIVSCCGAGYFIRRRVHTYTLPDRPDFNVTFTRHPILSPGDPTSHIIPHSVRVQHSMVSWCSLCILDGSVATGLRQVGFQSYGDAETTVISTAYPMRTHPAQVTTVYPVLPPYYSQPPPSYDQAIKDSQKK